MTRAMIAAEGGSAMVVSADVADEASCAAAVAAAVARWGRVDVLVNNVGIAGPSGNAVDVDPAAWDAAMRINLASGFLMTRATMRVLREQGSGGSLVYVASKNAFGPGAALIGTARSS